MKKIKVSKKSLLLKNNALKAQLHTVDNIIAIKR